MITYDLLDGTYQKRAVKTEYRDWIRTYYVLHNGFVRGKCKAASLDMISAFPELVLKQGLVECSWGEDQHFWCMDPEGVIVDPTESQFQGLLYKYMELDMDSSEDRDLIPTGTCANCDGKIYGHFSSTVCSDKCGAEYMAYINEGL